jgi:cellulose biosynthesis protein BcsQ
LYPSEISFRVKIVAVTNIKGGVGKTTTAVNLAYLCAAGGRPTVLWDLDPQGAATYTLKCEPGERVSARKLVAGKRELPELIVHTGYDKLDVLRAADVVVVPLLADAVVSPDARAAAGVCCRGRVDGHEAAAVFFDG